MKEGPPMNAPNFVGSLGGVKDLELWSEAKHLTFGEQRRNQSTEAPHNFIT